MNSQEERRGQVQSSLLLVLVSYTVLVFGLTAETILMSWELWALPLILGGVAVSWAVQFRQRMTAHQQLWVYTTLMMATFFFYGIHITSVFDMSLLMMIEILIFTTTGERALVTFCQLTYFVTLAFDLVVMLRGDTEWDSLLISRLALHIALMLMSGWLARFIIRQWGELFGDSEERIRELDRKTERMNRFLANLSHELRTPINAILGITSTMRGQELDEGVRQDLETVYAAGGRLAEQIGDILDYSELETERYAVNAETCMLSSLLNDLASRLRLRMPAGLELVIDVDPDTPAALVTDPVKLYRILYHLIGNGLKYTRQGGVYVHICCARREYGVNLLLEVRDTGIGMSREEVEQVSNLYYQADSGRTMHAGGLGLGLFIASGFVHALGGFLMIDSAPGEGTTVRVSLPQKVADEQPCMSVAHRERVNLGAFLRITKFSDPRVREFYNSMIFHMVQGLNTPMHRVDNPEDLQKLLKKVRLTHLFVAVEEYLSAQTLIEELAHEITVVLVAEPSFRLPNNSQVLLMEKPFYCFPVAALLNMEPLWQKQEERPNCTGVHALVVDDEPMNLKVATSILRQYGMSVTTASSGEEAVRLCAGEDYDIVFMDHMMPGMDGVEAMKRVRHETQRRQRTVSVVALTANALSTAKEMFLREGFDAFLSKPIELPELERVLRRVLPKSAFQTALSEEAVPTPPEKPDNAIRELTPEPEQPSFSERLAAGGIDSKVGLGYCMHDEDLYLSLLRQFAEEAAEKEKRLEDYLKAGNMADYRIQVHALKSTARTIGAAELSEEARRLEAAAADEKTGYVRSGHAALISRCAETVSAIRAALGEADGAEKPDTGPGNADTEYTILEFEPEEGD